MGTRSTILWNVTSVPGSTQFIRGRVVGPDHIHDDVVVTVSDGRIASIDTPHEWRAANPTELLPSFLGTLLPGLVDINCHDGGEFSFATSDPVEAELAAEHHAELGTTSVLATLPEAPLPVLLEQITALYPLALGGEIAGIHLEVPTLDHLPTAELLVEQGEGTIRLVTLNETSATYPDIAHLLDLSGVCIDTGTGTPHTSHTCQLDRVRSQVQGSTVGLTEAVRSASIKPAEQAGIDDRVGAIAVGLRADILVVDDDLELQRTMWDGVWLDDESYLPQMYAV